MTNALSVKMKFLVQGLYPVKEYKIRNFNLEYTELEESLVNNLIEESAIYAPQILINASFQEEGKKAK